MGFSKKKFFFRENSKGSKFAVECDWTGKISQSVQYLVFLVKKYGFFEKSVLFEKTVNVASLL